MPIKSEPYYFAECDNCGERCDYGDYTAWGDREQAIESTLAYEWTEDGGRWHCPQCPLLPRDETDCNCPTGDACPCEADGAEDGLCACCRDDEHRGSCRLPAVTA